MSAETFVIELDDPLPDCYAVLRVRSRAQELAAPLGLVILDVQQGSITVMNTAQQDDGHFELRVRELASRLRRHAAVRPETGRERRQRRARGDGLTAAQTWSPRTRYGPGNSLRK
jgi:hypothetical protein